MVEVGEVSQDEQEEEDEGNKSVFKKEFRAERVLSADCANEAKRHHRGVVNDEGSDSHCTLRIVETDDLLV